MDEKELIERCIAGDDNAWRQFLKSYGGCIYGTIATLLGKFSIYESEVSEDIFASVIEKLLIDNCRALRRFRWNSRFSTWLVSVTRNKTYDYLRRERRKPTVSIDSSIDYEDDRIERVIAADIDLDHDLEVQLTLQEALDMLPAKDRLILKLYYVEGMKEKEIGELIGLSVDAISARKSRALKRLRILVHKTDR